MNQPDPFPTRQVLERQLEVGLKKKDADQVLSAAWRLYAKRLIGLLTRCGVPHPEREDARARVFLQVLDGLEGFQPGNFEGWIFQLARYQARAWRTRQQRERERPGLEDPWRGTQDLVLLLDARELLDEFAEELTQADALILFSFEQGGDKALLNRLRHEGAEMTSQQLWTRRHLLRQRIQELLSREGM